MGGEQRVRTGIGMSNDKKMFSFLKKINYFLKDNKKENKKHILKPTTIEASTHMDRMRELK